MKNIFKKPDASTLLGVGGMLVGGLSMLIKHEQDKNTKNETINKAAEKAAKMVMEQMSSKKD